MTEQDFYLIHLDREIEIRKRAEENGIIKIEQLESCAITPIYVMNEYVVKYQGKWMFRFNLKTSCSPLKTFVLKNNKNIEIDNERCIEKFITMCENFSLKLIEDHRFFNNYFHIGEWNVYLEEYPLKINDKKNNNFAQFVTKIIMNWDNTYNVIINEQIKIQCKTTEEVINLNYLSPLRKGLMNSFLKMMKINN